MSNFLTSLEPASSPRLRVVRDEDAPAYDGIPETRTRTESFTMIPCVVRDLKDGYCTAVFEAIARHFNERGEAWPSVATIADLTGWSTRHVLRTIQKLIDAGIIEREHRALGGMKSSNLYRITANVQIRPTVTTLRPSVTQVVTDSQSGSAPQSHELEPIELNTEELDTPPKSPKEKTTKPLPENGTAQQIVSAYCTVARLDQPANYRKAVGQAAQLAKAGVAPEDIADLYAYVAGWAKGADLGLMLNQVDRWRSSKRVPAGANGMPPEIKALPWNSAARLVWEQKHRDGTA